MLGQLVSPVVQLTRSFTAVGEFFKAGDVTGAVNELINIPANVTNAFLNGAGYLDLTAVANEIDWDGNGQATPLPDSIKSVGLNLGGLVGAPVPFEGTLEAPTKLSGGVAFDGLAAEAAVGPLSVTTPGLPVSWIGSTIGLGQFLGEQMLVTAPAPVPPNAAASTSTPDMPADPVTPAAPDIADVPDVPADDAAAGAARAAQAPTHRGGRSGSDNGGSGNSSQSRGHRGVN